MWACAERITSDFQTAPRTKQDVTQPAHRTHAGSKHDYYLFFHKFRHNHFLLFTGTTMSTFLKFTNSFGDYLYLKVPDRIKIYITFCFNFLFVYVLNQHFLNSQMTILNLAHDFFLTCFFHSQIIKCFNFLFAQDPLSSISS